MADEIFKILNTIWTVEDGEKWTCYRLLQDELREVKNWEMFTRTKHAESATAEIKRLLDAFWARVHEQQEKITSLTRRIENIESDITDTILDIQAAGGELDALRTRLTTAEGILNNINRALAGDQDSPLYRHMGDDSIFV